MKVTDRQNLDQMEGASASKSVKKKSSVTSKPLGSVDRGDDIGSAKVKLSERAQDMKKIRSAVDSTPDADEAKIAKFKSLINSGQYKVDSKAVADKMVDEHAYNDFLTTEE